MVAAVETALASAAIADCAAATQPLASARVSGFAVGSGHAVAAAAGSHAAPASVAAELVQVAWTKAT